VKNINDETNTNHNTYKSYQIQVPVAMQALSRYLLKYLPPTNPRAAQSHLELGNLPSLPLGVECLSSGQKLEKWIKVVMEKSGR
jgi:hypothetical protein